MLQIRPVARHLVQRPRQQAAAGEVPIDCVHAEAQHVGPIGAGPAFDPGDAGAQGGEIGGGWVHALLSLNT
jgi:hypothetical protein